MRLGVLLLLVLVPVGWSAQARQTEFTRWERGGKTSFKYEFQDQKGRGHAISFALPTTEVNASLRAFKAFDTDRMQRDVKRRLDSFLVEEIDVVRRRYPDAEFDIETNKGWRVVFNIPAKSSNRKIQDEQDRILREEIAKFRQRHPGVGVRVTKREVRLNRVPPSQAQAINRDFDRMMRAARTRSRSAADRIIRDLDRRRAGLRRDVKRTLAAMRTRNEMLRAQYYSEHDRRLNGSNLRIPDYAKVAKLSVPAMAPVAGAWKNELVSLPLREGVARLLAFFQTIPYDTLRSRTTSNGAGFAYPVALLARNRGDCDTKSVAFATVLNQLYPKIEIVMVLLDSHALLGLAIPKKRGDRTIRRGGREYVLVEPVGPGLAAVGEIGKESRQQLRGKRDILKLF